MKESKAEILKQIGKVDDKILKFFKEKPELHPELLSEKDLKKALKAFEDLYEYSIKCAEVKSHE